MHMKDALDQLVAKFQAYAGEHSGKFGNERWAIPFSPFVKLVLNGLGQENEYERHAGYAS